MSCIALNICVHNILVNVDLGEGAIHVDFKQTSLARKILTHPIYVTVRNLLSKRSFSDIYKVNILSDGYELKVFLSEFPVWPV